MWVTPLNLPSTTADNKICARGVHPGYEGACWIWVAGFMSLTE
jgi:hypothetical protein